MFEIGEMVKWIQKRLGVCWSELVVYLYNRAILDRAEELRQEAAEGR